MEKIEKWCARQTTKMHSTVVKMIYFTGMAFVIYDRVAHILAIYRQSTQRLSNAVYKGKAFCWNRVLEVRACKRLVCIECQSIWNVYNITVYSPIWKCWEIFRSMGKCAWCLWMSFEMFVKDDHHRLVIGHNKHKQLHILNKIKTIFVCTSSVDEKKRATKNTRMWKNSLPRRIVYFK